MLQTRIALNWYFVEVIFREPRVCCKMLQFVLSTYFQLVTTSNSKVIFQQHEETRIGPCSKTPVIKCKGVRGNGHALFAKKLYWALS